MKKISVLFAAIVVLATAVSCRKEELSIEAMPSNGPLTFSCSVEALKSDIAGDGCPIWNVGDKIFVYNGAKAVIEGGTTKDFIYPNEPVEPLIYYADDKFTIPVVNAADIVERVVLTREMISADGKTASFSVNIQPATTTYFAIAEDKGSKQVCSFAYNGKVTSFQFHQHIVDGTATSSNAVRFSVASCPSSSNELFFKNVLSQLKFTVNDGTAYGKIVFRANDGSANTFACGISGMYMQGNDWGTAVNKAASNAFHTVIINNKPTGDIYVPLYFKANLDKGISIDFYSNTEDASPEKTITINKPFRIERNQILDLGNLDKVAPSESISYYANWQAGKDVIINGVAFNKNTFTKTAHYIDTDTELNNNIDGIWFVKEGVNLTTGTNTLYTDAIILCDKPGAKANLEIRKIAAGGCPFKPDADGANLRIKGMNINLSGFHLQYVSGKTLGLTGLYDCSVICTTSRIFNNSANSVTKNTEIISCDFKVTANDFILYEGTQNMKFDSITIKNCQIWSDLGVNKRFMFFYDPTKINCTVGTVIMENNTFYDLTFNNKRGLVCPNKLEEFYFRNNIWSYTSKNNTYFRILWLASDDDQAHAATEFPNYPDKGEILGNVMFNTDRTYTVFRQEERLLNKSWYPTYWKEFTKATSNPFTSVDVNKGVFVKAAGYELIGAIR